LQLLKVAFWKLPSFRSFWKLLSESWRSLLKVAGMFLKVATTRVGGCLSRQDSRHTIRTNVSTVGH
jgi:hypothetical protein